MEKYRVKEVWRCPHKGYWFYNRESAKAYAKRQNITLKEFKI